MDFRIENKEAFTVAGTTIQVSCTGGEHMRAIPRFWQTSREDGTIARLASIAEGQDLLGVCLDMKPDTGELTYMIAARTSSAAGTEGFVAATIPASAWAVFPCKGPIPGAIQSLFQRIFQEWFPASGYKHAPAPELEVYPPGDTASESYQCEVWIPVLQIHS